MKIRRVLTNDRIDNMYLFYKIVKELFEENETDELSSEFIFKEVMKRTNGRIPPMIIEEEIKTLI